MVESNESLVAGNGNFANGNSSLVQLNGSIVLINGASVASNGTTVAFYKPSVAGNESSVAGNGIPGDGNRSSVELPDFSIANFQPLIQTFNSKAMATDYIPRSEPQLAIWLANFGKKITSHGQNLGLTAEEIKLAETRSAETSAKIVEVEQKKTEVQQIVALKDDLKSDTLTSIRNFVTRIKAHTSFSEAIGQDLGIFASNVTAAMAKKANSIKTVLKAEVLPGRVRLSFVKKSFSGVNIYTRLVGTVNWQFLARDNNSPYDDERPLANGQPEKREYMAIGVVGDDEVGQPSDIISVVFGG
jgi:hypothetical protein